MIFSSTERTDDSPKKNQETDFGFLDRSARSEMYTVRALIEELVAAHPEDHRDEVIARIRSGDDVHFKSAIFEVLLYTYMSLLGYRLEPHPILEGSAKRPDFLVCGENGEEFYLEAVVASANYGRPSAPNAMIGTLLDALDQEPHQSFLVSVNCDGSPTTQPSGNKLKRAVHEWLNDLDPDEIHAACHGDLYAAPVLQWKHEGLEITVRALPLEPERRGKSKALIALLDDGNGGALDQWSPIRDAIHNKGRRYGPLSKPLIVAVNMASFHLSVDDEMEALFGQEVVRMWADGRHETDRAKNGAWLGPEGPRARRVSGAWIFNAIGPYTICSRRGTLYVNPWASNPMPDSLLQVPHARPAGNKMQHYGGVTLHELLKLPEGWPDND